ncbi:MAG: hypothetical protein U0169_25395 [Polyangiaceae bacterium]
MTALDRKFKQLTLLMEPEVNRMLAIQEERAADHDEAHYDHAARVVRYLRKGEVLWEPSALYIGMVDTDMGFWRWWWAGRIGNQQLEPSRLDMLFREGPQFQVDAFKHEQLDATTEEQGAAIANVSARLVKAVGVFRDRGLGYVKYFALFDAQLESRPSTSPRTAIPSRMPSSPSLAPRAATGSEPLIPGTPRLPGSNFPEPPTRKHQILMSIPPSHDEPEIVEEVRIIGTSASSSALRAASKPPPPPHVRATSIAPDAGSKKKDVRNPTNEVFAPLTRSALATLAAALTKGFLQAILIVNVDTSGDKARFFVQLVASDHAGDLHAVDATKDLMDATAQMISEDAKSGNGRWRRLSARISRGAKGIGVDLSVLP